MPGDKRLWRYVARLVADASIAVDQQTAVDVTLETEDSNTATTGHAYYDVSAYTKDDGVPAYVGGDAFDPPGIPTPGIFVIISRRYVAASPPQWATVLRFINLLVAHPTPVTVYYKVYRRLGLD